MGINDELESVILKEIRQSRAYQKSFNEIIGNMENRFNLFNPIQDSFCIETYFGSDKGEVRAKNLLLKDGKIKKEWMRPYLTKEGNKKVDFRGLYIFFNDSTPFYVGISKGVIGRILQHLKGKTHYTSTLAFKIGLIVYKFQNGVEYDGQRKEFDFKKYVEPVKIFLMKQKISLFHIDNIEELAIFEIFCSMKMGTWLNDFETH